MRDNHSLPCYQNQQQPSSTKGGSCYSVSLHCGESWSGWWDVLMLPRTHHPAEGDFPANLCDQLLTRWVGHRWCSLYPPRLSLSFFTGKHLEGTHNSTPCRRDSVENVTKTSCRPLICAARHPVGASAAQGSSPLAAHAGAGAGTR